MDYGLGIDLDLGLWSHGSWTGYGLDLNPSVPSAYTQFLLYFKM